MGNILLSVTHGLPASSLSILKAHFDVMDFYFPSGVSFSLHASKKFAQTLAHG